VFDLQNLGRMLIVFGAAVGVVGGVLLLADRVPFLGHLPGDYHFQRGNVGCYIPVATSIVISLLLTILLNIILRLLNK
jgi:hypothetical protein